MGKVKLWGVTDMFSILIVAVVSRMDIHVYPYIYVRLIGVAQFEYVQLIIHKLYLQKYYKKMTGCLKQNSDDVLWSL